MLDTSTCVFFLRGELHLDKIIREKGLENIFISEVTVFELKYGAENSANPKKSHRAVDKFVKGLTIIPIFGIVDQYTNYKVLPRKNGKPMHVEFDLIIGVTALANEMILVTDNNHDFRYLENLKLVNWLERK
ncbi:tRNA(fMet)-specific endonuclease VapC [Cyclobacterium lianum]|uniref:tRNA(fMet)-specific endonuclease VapC n=1 Tax=Cyclobacterium lianum TaxID=388280 RepID=A0A1M7Q7Y9_9BACT|nr:PIN domain-containing protein [Cyclobacterium lianum]SHN26606.1 tRNA(fMet)-specific endonuclease VapC [Cyclobacterium lianum]